MASHGVEQAKRNAAKAAVAECFPKDPRFVGIGSGTTIVYVVEAIKELGVDISRVCFVPTGYQSRQLVINAGLIPIQFDSLPDHVTLDIAFDGADEVDEDLNCIKGGGACLFQEKLVAMRAKEFICVADHRKLKNHLLEKWPTIPIEVAPIAVRSVQAQLRALGSPDPKIRDGHVAKAGPLKTDQDFFIIDAPFPPLVHRLDIAAGKVADRKAGAWSVEELSATIRSIEGVLEVGIFSGPTGPEAAALGTKGGQRPVACYFGMEDGSVTVRKAKPAGIPN
ncbi:MAG: hypothetical protein Q9227_006091 [Pyrenula ochraceoflavens]